MSPAVHRCVRKTDRLAPCHRAVTRTPRKTCTAVTKRCQIARDDTHERLGCYAVSNLDSGRAISNDWRVGWFAGRACRDTAATACHTGVSGRSRHGAPRRRCPSITTRRRTDGTTCGRTDDTTRGRTDGTTCGRVDDSTCGHADDSTHDRAGDYASSPRE